LVVTIRETCLRVCICRRFIDKRILASFQGELSSQEPRRERLLVSFHPRGIAVLNTSKRRRVSAPVCEVIFRWIIMTGSEGGVEVTDATTTMTRPSPSTSVFQFPTDGNGADITPTPATLTETRGTRTTIATRTASTRTGDITTTERRSTTTTTRAVQSATSSPTPQ
ncbi:mucin-2-like, partial [Plectropomus leopardus]|uniref:mucin-2-like n=1 Tax=Plectropomus leopardus TaxID=160734 RepID=UPI001C4CAD1F